MGNSACSCVREKEEPAFQNTAAQNLFKKIDQVGKASPEGNAEGMDTANPPSTVKEYYNTDGYSNTTGVSRSANPGYTRGGDTRGGGSGAHQQTEDMRGSVGYTGRPSQRSPPTRKDEHLLSLTFKKRRLGIVFTSDIKGRGAYVTRLDPSKNKYLKKCKLPLNAKLLKVDDKTVEMQSIDDITKIIIEATNKLPFTLVFCKPDGLLREERPDPNPERDLT